MTLAKVFLDEFCKEVSYVEVEKTLGTSFSAMVHFLQAFELWLEKRSKQAALESKAEQARR